MKTAIIIAVLSFALISFWALWSWYLDHSVKQPSYALVASRPDYQIRRYQDLLVASVRVEHNSSQELNNAFRIIARFIFGNNTKKHQVAMTAPVVSREASSQLPMTSPVLTTRSDNQGFELVFIMPAEYTKDSLPEPLDKRIQVSVVKQLLVGVATFGWYPTKGRVQQHERDLQAALERDGYAIEGAPMLARYNPPFAFPLLMKNEVWIPVRDVHSS